MTDHKMKWITSRLENNEYPTDIAMDIEFLLSRIANANHVIKLAKIRIGHGEDCIHAWPQRDPDSNTRHPVETCDCGQLEFEREYEKYRWRGLTELQQCNEVDKELGR